MVSIGKIPVKLHAIVLYVPLLMLDNKKGGLLAPERSEGPWRPDTCAAVRSHQIKVL
jgi:hypothetical protein